MKRIVTDVLVRCPADNKYVLVDERVHGLEALHLALKGWFGYNAEALAVVNGWAKSSTKSCFLEP